MPDSTGMVAQHVPVMDNAGQMTRPWFNLLNVIWQITQNGRAAVASTPFTMKVGNQYAFVSIAPAAVTLPNVTGIPITVKDSGGLATLANPITVTPPYGLIDGAATATLVAAHQSQTYVGDGSNWWII